MAFGVDRSGAASGSGASDDPITEAIIDAKGDLIAGSAADTPVRVPVGTDEQRLVAKSSEAGGLGYVSDTTNYAIAAKGDLLAGTAADTLAPLTVGAVGQILFPASGASTGLAWLRFPSAGAFLINGKITRSVSGDALTLAVKTLADADPSTSSPVYVLMPTATSNVPDGGYAIRSITSALSMTVSSGSTLGHTSAVACPLYTYLLDNAGTLELAVSTKFFGGVSVQSTTAEGGAGAADSATTLYSTTLRSNVVVVCVQRWKSIQTTAGTWAATTGEVQLYPFPRKNPKTTVHTSTGTHTRDWDTLWLKVTVVGGGGSGGASQATGVNQNSCGGGGGGGGFSIKTLDASAVGATETATVGAGGAQPSAGAAGNDGGTSSFGSHCSATGGAKGGLGGVSGGSQVDGLGGAGGTGSSGDINGSGQAGGWAWGFAGAGFSVGGTGGSSIFGGGGRAASTTGGPAGGGTGGAYGAGGAGTATGPSQSAAVGSAGAAGVVIVEEHYV